MVTYTPMEAFLLTNSSGMIVTALFITTTVKLFFMTRNAAWDGWHLLTLSTGLLSLNFVMRFLSQYGIDVSNAIAALSAAAGLLAAFVFMKSSIMISKSGAEK